MTRIKGCMSSFNFFIPHLTAICFRRIRNMNFGALYAKAKKKGKDQMVGEFKAHYASNSSLSEHKMKENNRLLLRG
ncbi:hypothetical protein [uncultured Sunxiuqinia sp.]|uniref:hypothetical protein n=1 Tax=Sunxiuqinia rutila TaxID=1397841 RepID=UPI00260BFC95|nr:hypothetical protein [uncultured Sunxiuqinia sp.]